MTERHLVMSGPLAFETHGRPPECRDQEPDDVGRHHDERRNVRVVNRLSKKSGKNHSGAVRHCSDNR